MTARRFQHRMQKLTIFVLCVAAIIAACSSPEANVQPPVRATPTPIKTPIVPKNGDYPGRGKITKINNELGSVEFDHDEIPGLMPAMRMEFFVTDKAMLKGLKVGDNAQFTVRYNEGQENIIALSKAK